jgi:hypothetical protein
LSAVAKALGMYCFSDRYRLGVGSYFQTYKSSCLTAFVTAFG